MGFLNCLKGKKSKDDAQGMIDFEQSIKNNLSNENISEAPIWEDNLALNQPVKFINRYLNSVVIDNAIKKNPKIKEILAENNLEYPG